MRKKLNIEIVDMKIKEQNLHDEENSLDDSKW